MAKLRVHGDELVVGLSPLEKLGAFRGDVHVPLAAVRSARVSDRPWSELRSIRAPGTGFPGIISLCTRRGSGVLDFAAVYRGGPAVVVDLKGAHFDRLVVTCNDADNMVRRIEPGDATPGLSCRVEILKAVVTYKAGARDVIIWQTETA